MRQILARLTVFTAVGVTSSSALAAPAPPCAVDAAKQALKLLRFHTDGDDRASIDPDTMRGIGTVGSLGGKRRFDVIEVEGSVYKGVYRIRLIYAPITGNCVLMGQEIFERADPY